MTGQSPETIPGRRNNGSATDTALRCLNRRPTTKQLKLIKELNGDARSVRTRHDASELISRLRQEEAERRYREGLGSLPPPGRGHDLHPRLLSMANLAVRAGIPPDQASAEIEALIPPGGRLVPEREIMEAVRKAYGSPSCGSESPQRARRTGKRARRTGKRARRRSSPAARHRASKPGQERQIDRTGERDAIIAAGPEVSPVEFRRISPIQISNSPHEQEQLVLSALFEPGQYVFAGRRYDAEVTAAGVLLSRLRSGLSLGPYLIVNPFTGQKAPCKDSAKLSYRCDNALAKLRYAVAEFDALPMGGQLAFWRRVHGAYRIFSIE